MKVIISASNAAPATPGRRRACSPLARNRSGLLRRLAERLADNGSQISRDRLLREAKETSNHARELRSLLSTTATADISDLGPSEPPD